MTIPTRGIALATIIVVTLGITSLASTHSAGPSSGVYMEFDFIAHDDGTWHHSAKLWLVDGRLRIDEMVQEVAMAGWATHMWFGGHEPAFVNIAHQKQWYMRATPEEFFGAAEPEPEDEPALGASETLVALRTGSLKLVEHWNAFEVEIREPGPEGERKRISETEVQVIGRERRLATLWMSEQPEVDVHSFSVLLVSSIDWYLARSGGDAVLFRVLTAICEGRVEDLPAGFPVGVSFSEAGPELSFRVVEYRPIADSIFTIPSDYTELDRTKKRRPS